MGTVDDMIKLSIVVVTCPGPHTKGVTRCELFQRSSHSILMSDVLLSTHTYTAGHSKPIMASNLKIGHPPLAHQLLLSFIGEPTIIVIAASFGLSSTPPAEAPVLDYNIHVITPHASQSASGSGGGYQQQTAATATAVVFNCFVIIIPSGCADFNSVQRVDIVE